MSLTSGRVYQFGDFELRVGARLLTRNGKAVPLGSKAFEVLTCLVLHAGEVVTKDELLKTVWPESFVEESNLSQHVFTLRKTLGDRSKFIATIPGRGYQFTAPVKELAVAPPQPLPADSGGFVLQRTRERAHMVIEESEASRSGELLSTALPPYQASPGETVLANSVRSSLQVDRQEGVDGAGIVHSAEWPGHAPLLSLGPPPKKHTWRWILAALACVLAVAGILWWRHASRQQPVSQKILVVELDNRTGDSDFDVVLTKALEIDLDQSPYIDVMSEPEARSTLRLMGKPPETALTPVIAEEVCERANHQALVTGSIANLGQRYLLTIEANDCATGKRLAEAKVQAAGKEETLAAMDSAADELRRRLGESAQSIERFQVPIAQATTSSLDALRQYSTGEYLLGRMGKEENEVLPFFLRAAELDPHFAMAQVAIATSYYSQGEYTLATPYYQKAFDLSNQVSERERLYIRAHYYADNLQDIEQGIKAYQLWAEVYPRDWGPWLDIANQYSRLGQSSQAIAAAEHAMKLDSSRGVIYGVLARAYMQAGRYADARSTAERAVSLGKDSRLIHATLFETAFAQHDNMAMAHEIAWSKGKPGEWDLLRLQALAAAANGRLAHAEELFQTAYDAAKRENLTPTADDILISRASTEANLMSLAAARATLSRLQRPHEDNPEVAILQANLSGTSSSHTLPAQASADNRGTLVTYVYEPRLRATIALHEGKPQEAIAALKPALDYDFAGGFPTLTLRAEAYLSAKDPTNAVNEYNKIANYPGVDPTSPLLPLACLGRARAEAHAGNPVASRKDYEKLFALWKQADANLPALVLARREYASLPAH
jgi:eukaryotic-like serine/threonine-protein kinase